MDPVRNEVFQGTSLRTLVQMVAAELGITLMPQIAVDSELASTRNVVIRPLSPDKPFRTLVLAWRPTTSRGAEFRMLGNLIRECLTGTKRAFGPDHDIEALAARRAARQVGIHCGDACVLARRHRLLRLMPSKFPVSDWEPGDHMWPGREMITNGSGH